MGEIVRFPTRADDEEVIARAQEGPQRALVKCPIAEIFFGGARGGGKSFGLYLKFIQQQEIWGAASKGVFFRKTYKELENLVEKGKQLLIPLGGDWLEGKYTFIMPNGSTLKLRHLGRDADADDYQGHDYTLAGFDELPNWARPEPIDKIRATLRSDAGVPVQFVGTGNPGGVGHNWVKARYIDPCPPYKTFTDPDTGLKRVFIPSRLQDNPALLESDPDYVQRLKQSGPDWLVRAWLNGDWDIVAGGMFDDIWTIGKERIVLPPFVVPASWRVDRSFDAGWAHPFSVGWWAESDGTAATLPDGTSLTLPRGSIVRVSEWYGYSGKPNEGINMLPTDIGKGIAEREAQLKQGILKNTHKIYPGPADTEIWNADKGVAVADEIAKHGITFEEANKAPGSRVNGWQRMRGMLTAAYESPRENPGLYVFETCRDWIRTVPGLPRDERKIDDVDTDAEDHIADETRYRVLHVRHTFKESRIVGL